MRNTKKKRPLELIASDFFDYLGRHLPQQCASDEFYFLPRSEVAIQYTNSLDDLTPEKIQDYILYAQNLLSEIPQEEQDDLEGEIDRILLKQSIGSFVREFNDVEVWKNDPTLYVKIPLLATDRIISQSNGDPYQVKINLSSLFTQIPSFLSMAIKNLNSPSQISLKVALDLTQDAIHFYDRDIRAFIEENMGEDKGLLSKNLKVLGAWKQYKKGLLQLPFRDSFAVGYDGLEKIISISFSYPKSPEEILEIAQYSYQKIQGNLRALALKIDSCKTWNLIVNKQLPVVSTQQEVLKLYQEEVQALRRFFLSKDIINFPSGEKVTVLQTPFYLQSLRATASYAAPLTGNTKGNGVFYITPGKEDLELISSHCPYLSSHETYPGHHILDHIRIHHLNPLRRQIESPLFYEGWACYAEQLLDELGYVQDPRRQLVQLQRQLWRCLRAILDVELQTGKIRLSQAAKKIQTLGFSGKRAKRQVRRFCLTPGYQLCYFMGAYEIIRLQEQFSSRLGLRVFHDTLLSGGEIPFHLVEKRMKEKLNEND